MDIIILIMFLALVGGLVLYVIFRILDNSLANKSVLTEGQIQHLDYTPSQTGIGPSMAGGHAGVAVTSTSEEWNVIVKLEDGSIEPIKVEKETWANYKVGDKVKIKYWLGRFSGHKFGYEIL